MRARDRTVDAWRFIVGLILTIFPVCVKTILAFLGLLDVFFKKFFRKIENFWRFRKELERNLGDLGKTAFLRKE